VGAVPEGLLPALVHSIPAGVIHDPQVHVGIRRWTGGSQTTPHAAAWRPAQPCSSFHHRPAAPPSRAQDVEVS
jgi:hypothetical protein